MICTTIHPPIITPPNMAQLYCARWRRISSQAAVQFTKPTMAKSTIPGTKKLRKGDACNRLTGICIHAPSGRPISKQPETVAVSPTNNRSINKKMRITIQLIGYGPSPGAGTS